MSAINTRTQEPVFLRYLILWLKLARNCFLRQSEYKIDFLGRLIIECVWVSSQIIFFKSIFKFIPTLGSWTEPEIWFFVASLIFADGLMMMLLHDNLNKFGQVIRLGLLDFYLLYPVSAVFLSTLRFVNLISSINISFAIALMIYAVQIPGLHLSLGSWAIWAIYVPLGTVMIGALVVIVSSVAFWTTQSSNLTWLFYELYRLGFRPENLYSPWLRRLLLSAFPAAFFISVPVQLALGKLNSPLWFAAPWIVTAILILIARTLWARGIRLYEGAMS